MVKETGSGIAGEGVGVEGLRQMESILNSHHEKTKNCKYAGQLWGFRRDWKSPRTFMALQDYSIK